jgi:hypothetical protein
MVVPRPADACTPIDTTHELRPVPGDTTPPDPVILDGYDVAFDDSAGGCGAGDGPAALPLKRPRMPCPAITGNIRLSLTLADDMTPSDQIGCFVNVEPGGVYPEGLYLYRDSLHPDGIARCDRLDLSHGDEGDTPFRFELVIWPIDASGNIGPPTTFLIESGHAAGCAAGRRPTHPLGGLCLAVLTFGLVVRRRR